MMDASWYLAVAAFAIAMSFTPGPNNMMVLSSGATWGLTRTIPHIAGIAIGFPVMMLVLGLGGQPLLTDARVHIVLKWAGAAYLLWLAWHIATADPTPPEPGAVRAGARPLSFIGALAFQWINPKAWIIAASALATFAGNGGLAPVSWLTALFAMVTIPATLTWTLLGVGAARILRTRRALRRFNLTMAALLVASLIPVLRE